MEWRNVSSYIWNGSHVNHFRINYLWARWEVVEVEKLLIHLPGGPNETHTNGNKGTDLSEYDEYGDDYQYVPMDYKGYDSYFGKYI